jgi:hypothetical protein
MLSPRLTDCSTCSSITSLICDIDTKLNKLSSDLYNNSVFMLNKPFNGSVMSDLLNYKRILMYKLCNPDYARTYTIEKIASKVKLLKFK